MSERAEAINDAQDQLGDTVEENNALKKKCSILSKKVETLTEVKNDLIRKLNASESKCSELWGRKQSDEAMKVISVDKSMVSSYENYKDSDLRQIAGMDLVKDAREAGITVSTSDYMTLRAGGIATHPVKVKYLKLLGTSPENVVPVNSFENSENVSISRSPRMGNNPKKNNHYLPTKEVVTFNKATDLKLDSGIHAESTGSDIVDRFPFGNDLSKYLNSGEAKKTDADSESVTSAKRKTQDSSIQTRSKIKKNNIESVSEGEEVDMQCDERTKE